MDEREGSGSSGCAFDLFKLVKNVVDNTKKKSRHLPAMKEYGWIL